MQLSRRRLGKWLAASATVSLVSGAAAARPADAKSSRTTGGASRAASRQLVPDVLVLGGGLSGLNAAMLLEEQGARVTVIEARDRVGGRVETRFDLPGYPELGGTGFSPGYGRVLDRARGLGVRLQDLGERKAKHRRVELALGGRLFDRESWADSPLNPLPQAARSSFPAEFAGAFLAGANPLAAAGDWLTDAGLAHDVSLHAFLRARGLDERTIRLCWSTNAAFGGSAHEVSALYCLFSDAWAKATARGATLKSSYGVASTLSVLGGNQKLPMAMAASLKSEVHLGKEVVAITEHATGIEARCRDGSRFQARRMLCSLPFSVLRTIAIDPPLEGDQAAAVQLLCYQPTTLALFEPLRPFWEADGLSPSMWTDGSTGYVMAMRFGAGDDEVTTLLAEAYGPTAAALDRLAPEDALRRVQLELEALRPAARGALRPLVFRSWGRDPFSACDWSYFGPGHVRHFANAIARPRGRLHFCGEHTSRADRGMEGAMESGERAALELLDHLQGN